MSKQAGMIEKLLLAADWLILVEARKSRVFKTLNSFDFDTVNNRPPADGFKVKRTVAL